MATSAEGSGLSPGLARLWGLDRGSRPGQRPSLDVRQIAEAGIAVADEGGLAAVSMSRVAKTLGVTTMALYRYVESKDELLELMLDVAAGDPPPLDPTLSWREALRTWAQTLAAMFLARPWLVDIRLPGPPRGPHQLAWAEHGMAVLRDTGLTPAERLGVVLALLVHVRGEAGLLSQLAASSTGDTAETDAAYYAFMSALPADRYPNFAAMAALEEETVAPPEPPAGAPDGAPWFGLELLLDGVEQCVRARGSAAP